MFVQTLWRDWLTAEMLAGLNLNERQLQAIRFVKSAARITNADYQRVTGVTRKTAARDLCGLVERGVLRRVGALKATYYVLARK